MSTATNMPMQPDVFDNVEKKSLYSISKGQQRKD